MSYMFYSTGYKSTGFTLDLGNKFDTSKVTKMLLMFANTGNANSTLELDLSTFNFTNVTSYMNMFLNFKNTQKIYVKDATDQNWVISRGGSGNNNLTTANVLIKS